MIMKSFFLALLVLAPGLASAARPARAVAQLGFTKRQNGWIGGSALHATGCPKDLQDCGNDKAQSWCCPKDTVCKSDYCCPTGAHIPPPFIIVAILTPQPQTTRARRS